MNRPLPTDLIVGPQDGAFLVDVAKRVLGTSTLAATNAQRLADNGFDVKRIDTLLPWESVAVRWGGYVFKKVEADPESPANFGLFVRIATNVVS